MCDLTEGMDTKQQATDVLIFVEDPGAANCVAMLPTTLADYGWRTKLYASGHAIRHLRELGIVFQQIMPSIDLAHLVDAEKPRMILTGTSENPNSLGLSLIALAKSIGITSIAIIDAVTNLSYRFSGGTRNPLMYAPDWLLVPSEIAKQIFVSIGFPTEQIINCGHPHYDYVLKVHQSFQTKDRLTFRQRVVPKAPKGNKIVIFAAEGSSTLQRLSPPFPLDEYKLKGRGGAVGRTEIVLEEFLDAVAGILPRPYLVLRPHPKDTIDAYSPYLAEFDCVDDRNQALELAYAADLVVGSTSMLLMEAAIMGIPTLSIVPREKEREWLPSIGLGATMCATTSDELRKLLMNLLQQELKLEGAYFRDSIPKGSTIHIVNFITSLLARHTGNIPRKVGTLVE